MRGAGRRRSPACCAGTASKEGHGPGPAEVRVAGKTREGPVWLGGPMSLLGLNLWDVLLGLMKTGEGETDLIPDGVVRGRRRGAIGRRRPESRVGGASAAPGGGGRPRVSARRAPTGRGSAGARA